MPQGSPSELQNMDRVASGTAKRLIVTQSGAEEVQAEEEQQQATALALSLQQLATPRKSRRASAVVAVPHQRGERGPVIDPRTASGPDGFLSYAEVAPADFVTRVLAQCVMQRGLSNVYEELLLQVPY